MTPEEARRLFLPEAGKTLGGARTVEKIVPCSTTLPVQSESSWGHGLAGLSAASTPRSWAYAVKASKDPATSIVEGVTV